MHLANGFTIKWMSANTNKYGSEVYWGWLHEAYHVFLIVIFPFPLLTINMQLPHSVKLKFCKNFLIYGNVKQVYLVDFELQHVVGIVSQSMPLVLDDLFVQRTTRIVSQSLVMQKKGEELLLWNLLNIFSQQNSGVFAHNAVEIVTSQSTLNFKFE